MAATTNRLMMLFQFHFTFTIIFVASLSSVTSCLNLEITNADEGSSLDGPIQASEHHHILSHPSQDNPSVQSPTEFRSGEQDSLPGVEKDVFILPNSSIPIDYIQVLASYMEPDVFHRFLKGLNKTLNTTTMHSHPNFTYADDETAKTPQQIKYPCLKRSNRGNRTVQVRIVNSTELTEAVSYKDQKQNNSSSILGGYCTFVMFYAPWCKFSASAASAFNAIGRAFPDLEVLAIDAFQHNSLNTRYGIVAVPNILLFHNSKPVMRFNYSQRSFSVFTDFIRNFTGLEPNSSVNISDKDINGPLLSVPTEEPDYALWFSWLFLTAVAGWCLKQRLGSIVMDRVRMFVIYARQVWRTGEFYDQVGVMVHEHRD